MQTYNRLIHWPEVRARPPHFRVRAVRPHSLAFLLLGVGQILDLVGLCALSCSVAACWLRSVKVRFGHLGGILLARPTLLFLDEGTSALDEGMEHAMYDLVRARFPECTIVSVGHRSTLESMHTDELMLLGEGRWEVRSLVS